MRRNKAKILLSVLVLAILAVAFCACGKIDFTYRQNSDGTYTQFIDITLSGDMSDTGYTVDEALAALKTRFEENGYTAEVYGDLRKFHAEQTFASLADLQNNRLSNGLDTVTADDTGSNAFVEKMHIEARPIFSESYLAEYKSSLKYYMYNGKDISITQAEKLADLVCGMDTSYTFETPYKSVTSNADTITESDGYYVHKWNLDDGDSVVLNLSQVNTAVWFGIAIVAAAFITLIAALVKVLNDKFAVKKAAKQEE